MKSAINNWVRFVAALLIFVQALTPTLALAQVSMRCRGMDAACFKAVVPSDTASPRHIDCPDMPCCRHMKSMMRACSRSMSMHADSVVYVDSATAPRCIVVVKSLMSSAPPSVISVHRWLVAASPAHAPPAVNTEAVPTVDRPTSPLSPDLGILLRLLTRSHALRAPPVA